MYFPLLAMFIDHFLLFPPKEIRGNMDKDTAEGRILDQPIIARYLRIHPTAWYGHICMRVELYGCKEGVLFTISLIFKFCGRIHKLTELQLRLMYIFFHNTTYHKQQVFSGRSCAYPAPLP